MVFLVLFNFDYSTATYETQNVFSSLMASAKVINTKEV